MRNLLLVAGLACTTVAWAKEPAPQVPAELVASHGFLFLEAPKGGMLTVSITPEGGGKAIPIPAQAGPHPGGERFGYWLPAGRYRLSSWANLKQANGPVFDIEAGRATDLGEFVPVNVGGYQVILLPVRHAEDSSDLDTIIAPFKDLLRNHEALRWNATAVPEVVTLSQPSSGLGLIVDLLLAHDRKVNKPSTLQRLKDEKDPAAFLALARTVVPPLQDEPALAPDGTAWFPADLGQLRRRKPDGSWDNVGIDTLRQLLAVEFDQGRLVAGSDDGQLRLSADEGTHWSVLKQLGSSQAVLDIDRADGTWIVVTTERFDDPKAPRGGAWLVAAPGTTSVRLRVYTARLDDLSDLAVSKEFTLTPKEQIGWLGARGQLVDGRYFVSVGNVLQRLDIASGTWTMLAPGPKISTHHVDPATGVVSAFWSQGAFSKVYVSSDHGDTWTTIGRPPYIIQDVQMDAADRGWSSRWNMDAFSGRWELYAYNPSINDWQKAGEAPFSCKPLRYSPNAAPICITTGASIFGLHGGQWEVEFSAN